MKSCNRNSRKGFTLVELLVVIVIIAILAAISVVAYNGITSRARDAQRANDIQTIANELNVYNISNNGVPSTATYGGVNAGGWNLSSSSSWLSFLKSKFGNIPTDPINSGIADPNSGYELTYFYYCYGASLPYVVLGYYSEATHQSIRQTIAVTSCL